MKIYVYAIAKNEKAFAGRFMRSCEGADGVIVLDTGSTDGTPDALRALGAEVAVAELIPWRFDVARNFALSLVPADADVCISLDLDEVLAPGWREALEAAWDEGTTRGRYEYVWSHTADGGDGVKFFADKIHARHGYHWQYPVHETLRAEREECSVLLEGLRIDHWPDAGKSRGSYLSLLELAVREDPSNDRHTHYLGREYYFNSRWGEAIETLTRHIHMPAAVWQPERAASMRYIARCFAELGDDRAAAQWYERAADEAPGQREAAWELTQLHYRRGDWALCRYWALRTLEIKTPDYNYMTDPEAWGPEPDDLAALACWHLGHYDEAESHAAAALELAPGDERLTQNLNIIREVRANEQRSG